MIRAALLFVICLGLAACAPGSAGPEAETETVLVPASSIDNPTGPGPDQLLHLVDTDVRQILGEPEFVWVEADAAMWRYRGQGCFVDVFLYPGEGVTFVDVHGDDLDDTARNACYRDLVKTVKS
jgi:hypothetical protein